MIGCLKKGEDTQALVAMSQSVIEGNLKEFAERLANIEEAKEDKVLT
jgi:uncharacterized protein (UPF0335 family)